MRIVRGGRGGRNLWGVQAAGGKFQHGLNLFSRYVELLNDFLDARTGLQILKDRRDRHTCAAKHPRAAAFAGNALHRRALRPIESWHISASPNLKPLAGLFRKNRASSLS